MRAVVQRVSGARVAVDGEAVAETGAGLCILLGVAEEDGEGEAVRLAAKVAHLRIFENDLGKFDLSVLDTSGGALVVSQFTLIADSKRQRGTRPDFSKAARPEQAEPLYELFCQELRDLGVPVQTGVFGARMQVELVNDGPITIVLETQPKASTGGGRGMTAGPLLQDVLVNVRRGRVAYLCLTPEQKRALRDPEGQVAVNVLRHLLGARPMNPERFPLAQEALQAIARRLGSLWLLRTSLQTRSAAARSAPR